MPDLACLDFAGDLSPLLQCGKSDSGMAEDVELRRQQESNDRRFDSWHVVVSAWAIVLLFGILLAGVSAAACLRGGSQLQRHLAGAVIPQHASCGGPGIASAPGVDGCKTIPLSQDRSAYW